MPERTYVLCSEGHKSYRIPGEKYYYCSDCEMKFESDDKPKIDTEPRILDVKPETPNNEPEEKEEEPMTEKKEGIWKKCPKCGEDCQWNHKRKGYYCAVCDKVFRVSGKKGKNKEVIKHTRKKGSGRKKGTKNKPKVIKELKLKKRDKSEVHNILQEDMGTLRVGQCETCIHRKVCGIIPQCPNYDRGE